MANSDDDDALIALALLGFALTAAQIAALGETILTQRLAAWSAAYQTAADTAGATVDDPTPTKAQRAQIKREATAAAVMIAATYRADLTTQARFFIDLWRTVHTTLEGCRAPLGSHLASWAAQRATWKAQQIANAECGRGADLGTKAAIGDVLDQTLPTAQPIEQYVVAVIPHFSSNDFCSLYAGNVYPLDQFDEIPSFPIHPSCVHETVLIWGDYADWL